MADKTAHINDKEGKMTLTDYYQSIPDRRATPRSRFLKEICRKCEVEMSTARNWVSGRNLPQKESYYKILSEMTGIAPEDLFSEN